MEASKEAFSDYQHGTEDEHSAFYASGLQNRLKGALFVYEILQSSQVECMRSASDWMSLVFARKIAPMFPYMEL